MGKIFLKLLQIRGLQLIQVSATIFFSIQAVKSRREERHLKFTQITVGPQLTQRHRYAAYKLQCYVPD